MRTLIADISASATQIAGSLRRYGYLTDFSPASLWDLEAFFSEHTRAGSPIPGRLLATQTGARLFALGSYLGETIRGNVGGAWTTNDDDEDGEINIGLQIPNGSICWPVQRVMRRLERGKEESIVVYAMGMGVSISPPNVTLRLRRLGRKLAHGW